MNNIHPLPSFEFLPVLSSSNSKAIQKFSEVYLLSFTQTELLFKEFYRFFYCISQKLINTSTLSISSTKILYAPIEILHIWEFHIENTAKYPSLCEKYGVSYVHYDPWSYNFANNSERELKDLYEETKELIKGYFGEVNELIWSSFEDIKETHTNMHNLSLYRIKNTLFKGNSNNLQENQENPINTFKKPEKPIENTISECYININEKILNENQVKLVNIVKNYVFSSKYLDILMDRLMLSAIEAELLIAEYKKFLIMSVICNFPIAPSGYVDEAWHLHMLFTKEYIDFSKKVGKAVILHVPLINDAIEEKQNLKDFYKQTIEAYMEIFGGSVDQSFWPIDKKDADTRLEHNFRWVNLR